MSLPSKEIRILLVEDNPAHAALVKRSFAEHEAQGDLVHLADGEAALNYLFREGPYADSEHPMPHLVLLDLRLPRVDGMEVLEAIKSSEALRRIPVVILTTSAAERDVARAYKNHANSYVVKPLDFERFQRLMHELRSYWSNHNVLPIA